MIGQLTTRIPDDVIQEQHTRLMVRMLMAQYTKREAKLAVAELADMWEPEFIAHVQRRIDDWVAA